MSRLMRDIPMLGTDRELMREEIEGFDDLTPEEFLAAVKGKQDELLDLMNALRGEEA